MTYQKLLLLLFANVNYENNDLTLAICMLLRCDLDILLVKISIRKERKVGYLL